jgi:hypothetical protein
VLWQHVCQIVVCVLSAVWRATSQAQSKLPEEGPGGPKHVGANITYFNVNFNILYV